MKILLILLFSSFLFGKTIDPSVRTITSALQEGYKVAFQGNAKYLVFNNCDTLEVNKASYSKANWNRIRGFYQRWKQDHAKLKRDTDSQVKQAEKVHREKVYLVAKENLLFNSAKNGRFGLDSTAVAKSRRSLTKLQNQYWRVIRLRLAPADTVGLRNNVNVHYLVPYEASFDSLKNYLNDLTSRPVWTTKGI